MTSAITGEVCTRILSPFMSAGVRTALVGM